ncbi:MAG: SIS domain-containing protein [Clostridia bacterium]|nr:SIS domain-containing protein [Clostridia bacterium]
MNYRAELAKTPKVLRALGSAADMRIDTTQKLIFCGCGTSYYLGAQAAHACGLMGIDAVALDAADALDGRLAETYGKVLAVFISRSGASFETLEAMRILRARGVRTLYLGCTYDSPLTAGCDQSMTLPFAREPMAMESYSSMSQFCALLRACGAQLSGGDMARAARAALDDANSLGRLPFDAKRHIVLACPYYMPLARELALKFGELTQRPSEAWGTLEFRHGPRSWADESCAVYVLPGVRLREYDAVVAEETAGYGARTFWFGDAPTPRDAVCAARSLGAWERYSPLETVYLAVLLTSLAARMGESLGVDASALPNITYAVEKLK